MRLIFCCVAVFAGLAGEPLRASQPIDDSRARSQGIRKLTGRHLVLYTDLPAGAEVDKLPAVFDQAVPQWCAYFGIDRAKTTNWQARAFVIAERRRFDALGLMPAGNNDQFVNGISVGSDMWLYDQPTPYYRRHLLLHEGTHVFMAAFLGGCGPGWYMEGTAELLATHRLDPHTGKLTLRIMPQSRAEVPMLGRIKLIRDARAAGRALDFPAVLQIDNRQQLGNDAYAWCWAACKLLDSHPRYRDRFRQLKKHVLAPDFNEIVRRQYAADWADLITEWQAFLATLDHGYDFERMAIDFRPGVPLDGRQKRVTIAADRGWQSSAVWLNADTPYRLTARGRYQIAVEIQDGVEEPWPCEPGGVTIEYHDGRPLGMLLAAVVRASPDPVVRGSPAPVVRGSPDPAQRPTEGLPIDQESTPPKSSASNLHEASFAKPMAVGLGRTVKPATSGMLYLRVNDSAAKLGDNRGTLTVMIEAVDTE